MSSEGPEVRATKPSASKAAYTAGTQRTRRNHTEPEHPSDCPHAAGYPTHPTPQTTLFTTGRDLPAFSSLVHSKKQQKC